MSEQDHESPKSDRLKPIVVLAAGHYPYSPGCKYHGLVEHDLNIMTTALVAVRLEDKYKVHIVTGNLKEKTDAAKRIFRQMPLREAVKAPNLCAVEMHFNGFEDPSVGGTEVLYGLDSHDQILAQYIQAELVRRLGLKDRGVKFADYSGTPKLDECAFTRLIKQPAVIVEPLFISNPEEAELIKNPLTQEIIADGIAAGIEKFTEAINALV